MSEVHPLIGALIDGKYRVDSVLGSGGMGVVFLARHEQLRERVAIKVLKPDRGGRPQLVERLFREARAAASLRSQHVVRVLDVGTIKPDAQPFIVMEYLQGEDLAACLVRRGPLPIRDAVDYLLEACEAVAEAHALGIVHRDLKPANLFLERRASGAVSVKVLDFGVARFLAQHLEAAEPDAALTSTHSFVGSPAYVSPEQLTSPELVDTRADVWALGVILYECSLSRRRR
jgi:serine/threonine-protein kinase